MDYRRVLLWVLVLFSIAGCSPAVEENVPAVFDGTRAYEDVAYQVNLGPRIPGTKGHEAIRSWLAEELHAAGWQVDVQVGDYLGHAIYNLIAKREGVDTDAPWIILGAHYDTRIHADQDARDKLAPVPGANDGASGVAVLLELARVLPQDLDKNVWLVFFDAEDNGRIDDWDWIIGSKLFADSLTSAPDAVVIVDMIGDADQNIYIEKNSTPSLVTEIWDTAAALGVETFIDEPKYAMLDDHAPFLAKEIRAVDIIDFDYIYWHTTEDTVDKVSAQSLENVGKVLLAWLQASSSP